MKAVAPALLLGLSLAAGCRLPPAPTLPIDRPERALALHASLRSSLRTVQADARVEQRGRTGRIRGTVWAILELPDHLRFDVITQLGPVATLTSDGSRFSLLDQRDGRFLDGPTCSANVARFLGVALEAQEVATLLIGGVPVDGIGPDATLTPIRGGYDLRIPSPRGETRVRFALRRGDEHAPPEQQYLRLAELELFMPDGSPRLRIRYDDYRVVVDPDDLAEPQHGIAMPFVVRIEDLANDAELTVRFTALSLNVEVVPDAFSQEPPGGMVVERAECDSP